jgi:uncharacterized delta-60 repeat protein
MKIIFTLFVSILFVCDGNAQPGTLDNSFGDAGKVLDTTYTGNEAKNLIQPDGKIVIAAAQGSYIKNGEILYNGLLARYNQDGSLDTEFGDDGKAICNFGDTKFLKLIHAIALQQNGKIVIAGQYAYTRDDSRIMTARFSADGSLDETFGNNGFTVIKLSKTDMPRDMVLLSDDRIVVTGDITNGDNDVYRSFIACFTPDGLPDKKFGENGVTIIELDTAMDINAIAVTKEDKIILGGQYSIFNKTILLRYDDKGIMDKSFGADGVAEISFPLNEGLSSPTITDIGVAPDNKIFTGGGITAHSNPYSSFLVSCFLENGMPDDNFGINGYVITEYNANARAKTIALQRDGKLLAGGNYASSKDSYITLVRYNQAGLIDSSFGENGIVNTRFYGSDLGTSLSLQNDGKIVFAGSSIDEMSVETPSRICIARYNNDDKTRKQIIITKIRRWIQHHNGFTWDANSNISNYVIQRSYDGIHFSSIARINAGNSSNYTYHDASPLNGTNYYRLQTTSISGAVANSNVIAVTNSDIKISPNPAQNILHIEGLSSSSKTKITVVDLNGNVASSWQLSANSSSYNLNIAALKPGNYWLKLEVNGEVVSKQFVKE